MSTKHDSPKIIQLHRRKEDQNADLLEKLATMARDSKLKGFVFAGYNDEGSIITACIDVTSVEMQTLISYLQIRNIREIILGEEEEEED